MSKKQREKVEDEVRFHRAQMRAQTDAAPDSSVFDQQTPSSTDQFHHYNGYEHHHHTEHKHETSLSRYSLQRLDAPPIRYPRIYDSTIPKFKKFEPFKHFVMTFGEYLKKLCIFF